MTENHFSCFTDKELQEELNQRARLRQDRTLPQPKQLEDIDFESLTSQAVQYVKSISINGYPDKDAKQYIFEAVISAYYGNDIWSWLSKTQLG